MGIAIFVGKALIVVSFAANRNLNVFLCDVKAAGRIRLINTISTWLQFLYGHNLAGLIRYKLVYRHVFISIAITLLGQLLPVIRHFVDLVCGAGF